jgi:hypothetical protein
MAPLLGIVCSLIAACFSYALVNALLQHAARSFDTALFAGLVVFFGLTAIVQPILLELQRHDKPN